MVVETILHEQTHRGNTKNTPGGYGDGEVGKRFAEDVYQTIPVKENGVEYRIYMNSMTLDDYKKIIEEAKKTEEGKKTLPEVPKNNND